MAILLHPQVPQTTRAELWNSPNGVSGCGTGPGKCLPKIKLYHVGHSSQGLEPGVHRHPSNRFHVRTLIKFHPRNLKRQMLGFKGTGHFSRQSASKEKGQGAKGSGCSWCSDHGIYRCTRFSFSVSSPGAWSEIGADPWTKNIVQMNIWSRLWRSHRWRSRAHIPICLRAAEHGSYRFSSTLPKLYSTIWALQKGQWLTSLDMKDTYCHIGIHPAGR